MEAWRLLKHNAIKDFIGAIARRTRKYRGCLVIATQNYSDFTASFSETAADVLASSDWRIMSGADNASRDVLMNNFGMKGKEGMMDKLMKVKTQKGLYSEYIIAHKDGGYDIGRLFLEPFSQKLYSSTAEDVVALNKLKAKGLTIDQAIEALMKKEV